MGVIVDLNYYLNDYKGTDADENTFPALNAHASRMIANMARWQVTEDNIDSFPSLIQTLYRLAVCSQIDFIAENGMEYITGGGGNGSGFTVGKVSVTAGSKSQSGGVMSANISPASVSYLEQTGLMYPGVPVVGGCVC